MALNMNRIRFTVIQCISVAFLVLILSPSAHAEGSVIKALPWGASAGLKYNEYLEDGDIADGYAGNISYRQAMTFHHPAEKWFDVGIFAKYTYRDSDNIKRSWENKSTSNIGLEIYKIYSTEHISWGKASLILGQSTDRHNELVNQGADATTNSISFSISASGNWLK